MANENFTWGEERIANELVVMLGISESPRTVRKYMPKRSGHSGPRNVTENPTADWARQQLREAIPSDHEYQYLIHDGDCIFSKQFDATVSNLGIKPIKTPYRSPKANALCERLIGTMRRECLDYVIPLTQNHLKKTLRHWTEYYNRSRPHSSIGPDIPCWARDKSRGVVRSPVKFKSGDNIVSKSILGGLHHDYQVMCA